MLVVLKNADFSANNIGKVEILKPISEKTQRVMTSLNKYPCTISNEYAQALNTLLDDLDKNGIYDKIELLSIPLMSPNVEMAGFDVISESVKSNTSTIYDLNENGELFYKGTLPSLSNKVSGAFSINKSSDDLCYFGATKHTGDVGGQILCLVSGSLYYLSPNTYFVTTNSKIAQLYQNGKIAMKNNNTMLSDGHRNGVFVASYSGNDVLYKDKYSNIIDKGVTDANVISLGRAFPLVGSAEASYISAYSMQIFGVGTSLTEEEVITMYEILNKFIATWE